MRAYHADLISSLFWLAVGLFFAVGAVLLRLGSVHNPGPGALPFVFGFLLVVFGLVSLTSAISKASFPDVRDMSWKRPAFAVALLFVYVFLLALLGFPLATLIFVFTLFRFLLKGSRNRERTAFSAAFFTALITWLVFSVLLKVPFPPGYLGTIWR